MDYANDGASRFPLMVTQAEADILHALAAAKAAEAADAEVPAGNQ